MPRWGKLARFSVALAIACCHVVLIIAISRTPSEGSWQWFPAFVIDFPASLVWLLLLQSVMSPLIFFGLFGSAWWFYLVIWFTRVIDLPPNHGDRNA